MDADLVYRKFERVDGRMEARQRVHVVVGGDGALDECVGGARDPAWFGAVDGLSQCGFAAAVGSHQDRVLSHGWHSDGCWGGHTRGDAAPPRWLPCRVEDLGDLPSVRLRDSHGLFEMQSVAEREEW